MIQMNSNEMQKSLRNLTQTVNTRNIKTCKTSTFPDKQQSNSIHNVFFVFSICIFK